MPRQVGLLSWRWKALSTKQLSCTAYCYITITFCTLCRFVNLCMIFENCPKIGNLPEIEGDLQQKRLHNQKCVMIDNKQVKDQEGIHKRCQDNSIHQFWKLLHLVSVPLDVMAQCVQPRWQGRNKIAPIKTDNVKQQHTREQERMEKMFPKRYAVARAFLFTI
jgi:hypothetical protein